MSRRGNGGASQMVGLITQRHRDSDTLILLKEMI